ncbi:MAG: sensor domain-containing diguanylate cyclase [Gemmatimonadaceae bacterium]
MPLSIGHKLTIAFGAALAIVVATGVVASRSTRELTAAVDHIAGQHANSPLGSVDLVPASDSLGMRAAIRQEAANAHASARRTDDVVRFGLLVAFALAPLAFLLLRHDFVLRREAERALRDSEARFRAAADGSLDAFYVLRAVRDPSGAVTDFEFADLNARAEALLGRPRDRLIGKLLCDLIPSNRTGGYFEKYVKVLDTQKVLEEEFEVSSPHLHAAWIHQQVVPLQDGVAISSRDISERKHQEAALRSLSLIDELTGLSNRRGFLALAEQQLKSAKRGHHELLLLFLDMDDFKEINDSYGHAEGDSALISASQILKKTFRDSDIIARLGGDEFVVLAPDPGAGGTEIIITRLRTELMERNAHDSRPYRLSFSVGVARFDPLAPPTIEELLATADSMLYEQKRERRQPELAAR